MKNGGVKIIIDRKRFDAILNEFKDFVDDNMYEIANMHINFFKESFEKEGWTDGSFRPWDPVKGKTSAILVESGDLKNSIKITSHSKNGFTIIADEPYAAIHNFGGFIRVTERMRKFFWAKYRETKLEKYKYMALMDVGKTIYIPQRKFMGNSKTLNNKVYKFCLREAKKLVGRKFYPPKSNRPRKK